MNMHVPAFTNLKPSQIVAEYDRKAAALDDAIKAFEKAGNDIKMACTIAGQWGDVSIDTGNVHESNLRKALLTSAWRHLYKVAHIDRLATASEKRRFDQSMADPAPFTIDNIRATFGKYISDPRGSILRGLAEAFCYLDPAFKSHDKMKIGVKCLPKRVILNNVAGYISWGKDRLENILNALATYQGKPLVEWDDIDRLLHDEDALLHDRQIERKGRDGEPEIVKIIGRGVRLRRFSNGNGHLFFEPETLRDVNLALAEFYGEVLADCPEERPAKQRPGTAVAKDLQYYPTPDHIVELVLSDLYINAGERDLEPSCGCGRFMDGLRKRGAKVIGYEVDHARAAEARAKGHSVITGNFLETVPTGDFDRVVMNPPFYGKHYQKHVEHALKFLKPGGQLVAILPATAYTDHGFASDEWMKAHDVRADRWCGPWKDLPIGSFSESGTNINTAILNIWRLA